MAVPPWIWPMLFGKKSNCFKYPGTPRILKDPIPHHAQIPVTVYPLQAQHTHDAITEAAQLMKEAVDDIMETLNEAASEVGLVGGMVDAIAEAMSKVGVAQFLPLTTHFFHVFPLLTPIPSLLSASTFLPFLPSHQISFFSIPLSQTWSWYLSWGFHLGSLSRFLETKTHSLGTQPNSVFDFEALSPTFSCLEGPGKVSKVRCCFSRSGCWNGSWDHWRWFPPSLAGMARSCA